MVLGGCQLDLMGHGLRCMGPPATPTAAKRTDATTASSNRQDSAIVAVHLWCFSLRFLALGKESVLAPSSDARSP